MGLWKVLLLQHSETWFGWNLEHKWRMTVDSFKKLGRGELSQSSVKQRQNICEVKWIGVLMCTAMNISKFLCRGFSSPKCKILCKLGWGVCMECAAQTAQFHHFHAIGIISGPSQHPKDVFCRWVLTEYIRLGGYDPQKRDQFDVQIQLASKQFSEVW